MDQPITKKQKLIITVKPGVYDSDVVSNNVVNNNVVNNNVVSNNIVNNNVVSNNVVTNNVVDNDVYQRIYNDVYQRIYNDVYQRVYTDVCRKVCPLYYINKVIAKSIKNCEKALNVYNDTIKNNNIIYMTGTNTGSYNDYPLEQFYNYSNIVHKFIINGNNALQAYYNLYGNQMINKFSNFIHSITSAIKAALFTTNDSFNPIHDNLILNNIAADSNTTYTNYIVKADQYCNTNKNIYTLIDNKIKNIQINNSLSEHLKNYYNFIHISCKFHNDVCDFIDATKRYMTNRKHVLFLHSYVIDAINNSINATSVMMIDAYTLIIKK